MSSRIVPSSVMKVLAVGMSSFSDNDMVLAGQTPDEVGGGAVGEMLISVTDTRNGFNQGEVTIWKLKIEKVA